MRVKIIDDIKDDYENILNSLEDLIDSVIQKYRQEVESEINSVCVHVVDDDNSTKLEVIAVSPKDVQWYEKYRGISMADKHRPSRVLSANIRKEIGKDIEEFIVRYFPEFQFYKRYDGEQ